MKKITRIRNAANDLADIANKATGATFGQNSTKPTPSGVGQNSTITHAFYALRALQDEMETATIKSKIVWLHCDIHDTEFTLRCPECK